MHNLHLVVIKAENAKDACSTVENELLEWGNENNWRTICGCVSKDNKVYHCEDSGRYPPDKDSNTIAKINKMVQEWINAEDFCSQQAIEKLKVEADITKWAPTELWSLQKYAEKLAQDYGLKGKKFNIWKDTYYEYKYDECGVTNMDYTDKGKEFVVFVDMHS